MIPAVNLILKTGFPLPTVQGIILIPIPIALAILISSLGHMSICVISIYIYISRSIVILSPHSLYYIFLIYSVLGITFVNPTLQWGSHNLAVSTDINYAPPQQQEQPQQQQSPPIIDVPILINA